MLLMPLTYKKLKSILNNSWYSIVHQVWSHVKFRKEHATLLVPCHDELKIWTARNILKDFCRQNNMNLKECLKQYEIHL